MRKNIKYEVWGGIRFFERKEIKDALCYLRLIANQDDLSFKRVVNTPGRLFGPASIEKLEQLAAVENVTLFASLRNHQDASFIMKRDEMSEFVCLIDECKSFIGKKSKLEIDSDDYAIYIAEYSNMISELHLDYFGRKTIREIQIFTDRETIEGDIVNNTVHFLSDDSWLRFDEARDDYQKRELNHFIDLMAGEKDPSAGFDHAIKVLELTQGIVYGACT